MAKSDPPDGVPLPEIGSSSKVVRAFGFALIVLISPIAVFLCGFCCCLGVMQIEGEEMYGMPGGFAGLSFVLGLLGGVALAVIALKRLRRAFGLSTLHLSERCSDDE